MAEFEGRIHVKVTTLMEQEINQLAEDTDIDQPELVRALLAHALKNPPDLMGKLADARRQLRDRAAV